ncbi:Uncharacterized protein SCF082_LOCUS18011 [Durusdinium trenchii]|uniref:Sugar phosphate transporter domain-containing protein n=1 Tax=Durusdinium trenchii TaxID=1381693 RepID=A0ABP0KNW1_9DINO
MVQAEAISMPAQASRQKLRGHRPGRLARQGSLHVLITLTAAFACWSIWDDETAQAGDVSTAFVATHLMKQLAICAVALVGGLAIYSAGGPETPAILMIYFGAQTGMNLYMKNVLSKIEVDKEEGWKGIPMGFLLTGIQQFVAFMTFACFLLASRLTSSPYQAARLKGNDRVYVLAFSLAFALNIGLNNFSISLVAISINMIIRSCLPVATAATQSILSEIMGTDKMKVSLRQWVLMIGGVTCAGIATWAKSHSKSEESANLMLGIGVTVLSIFAGALNMVLAGVMGTSLKLNPLDTTYHMALPAGIALLVPSILISHPVSQWPGQENMTDWEVLKQLLDRNPYVLLHVFTSGVLSLIYNSLQYTMVHKLSATHATFAGNFNKAATIALSLFLGLEALPSGLYGKIFVLAILGNITAFTAFSASKAK